MKLNNIKLPTAEQWNNVTNAFALGSKLHKIGGVVIAGALAVGFTLKNTLDNAEASMA